MKFAVPWLTEFQPDGSAIARPVLIAQIVRPDGRFLRETFIVDSGADISMAPRALCAWIGLRWEDGKPIQLHGISPREECAVPGMIHSVELVIREASLRLIIPVCFAEGDAPFLLGREGFFDAFRVQFDKVQSVTNFETAN